VSYVVDFESVSTVGLESSPGAEAEGRSRPLQASSSEVDRHPLAYVFYESGLSINVLYTLEDNGKRAVGFKLADGMENPDELADRFKFVRQRSRLAGTVRCSYFIIKGEY
jgi:hypothetical protein